MRPVLGADLLHSRFDRSLRLKVGSAGASYTLVTGALVALALVGTATGCVESKSWARAERCQAHCFGADCKVDISCDGTGEDCPIGTTCVADVCRPREPVDPSGTELIEGFHSTEVELTRSRSHGFEVEAPKDAVRVSCAIFIGLPTFQRTSIANLEASVARYRVFSVDGSRTQTSTISFRLDDLKTLPAARCGARPALNAGDEDYPMVESLRLGCWAVTLDAVVAATQLLQLDPSELPEFAVTPLESCDQSTSATDGSHCKLPSQIGVCKNKECKPSDGGQPKEEDVSSLAADAGAGCETAPDNTACRLARPGRGRCYGGSCLDKSIRPPLVTARCTSADEWVNCFPSPLGVIGTCFNRLCRQRCRDGADCSAGELCEFPPAASYLGVCKAATERG